MFYILPLKNIKSWYYCYDMNAFVPIVVCYIADFVMSSFYQGCFYVYFAQQNINPIKILLNSRAIQESISLRYKNTLMLRIHGQNETIFVST